MSTSKKNEFDDGIKVDGVSTFSSNVTMSQNLTVVGDLNVTGNTTFNQQSFADIIPNGNNYSLGNANNRWSISGNTADFSQSIAATGNLTIGGTTILNGAATVNTATFNTTGNNHVLNSSLGGSPTTNAGITVNRGTSANSALYWDETNKYWASNANGAVTRIVTNDSYVVTWAINIGGQSNTALTANNSTNLNGQAASYYLNASNINAGTLADTYLPATMSAKTFSAGITVQGAVSSYTSVVSNGSISLSRTAATTTNSTIAILSGGTADSRAWALIANSGGQLLVQSTKDDGTIPTLAINVARSGTVDFPVAATVAGQSFAASAFSNTVNASNITGGTLGTARVGSGTANSSTYLRGDQTWVSLAASATTDTTNASNISSGTLGTARHGTGTANSTTILRGNQTWDTIPNTLGYTPANIAGDTFTGTVTAVAGTTTVAPFKFQNSVKLTTPANNVFEWDGASLWMTSNTGTRRTIAYTDSTITGDANNASFLGGQNQSYYLNAGNLNAGTVGTARLGSGTANSSTYLRGDSTWVSLAASATTDTTVASNISSGTLGTARLGSGTANSTTILRGNQTWDTVVNTIGYTPANKAGDTFTGTVTFVAGNTTINPFKFQAGATLTTPVAHAVEWDGSALYVTQSAGPTRKTIAYTDSTITGDANNTTYLNGQAASFYTSATNITSGTLGTARLGSGTANSSTYLRGDQTWVSLAASATTDTTVASNISSGTLATARIGSGTANSTTILRGDQTWNSIAATLGFTPANIAGDTFTGTVTLVAGNTTVAPLKWQNSSKLTTPANNVFEWDGANLWQTSNTGTRRTIAYTDGDITGSANNTTYFSGQLQAYYLNAGNLNAGTIGTARLGSSSATSSTYLRGDSTWVSLAASATTNTTDASNISSGTLGTARVGSGTANSSTYLRGDQSWATIAAGDIGSGTIATARLGAGTANSTTILRGIQTYDTIPNILGYTPANKAGETFTGQVAVTTSNATANVDYILFQTNDYATNKPRVFLNKTTTANVWYMGLYDGTNNSGTLDFKVSNLAYNGTSFAASATTDTTVASNISSGTLGTARLGSGTANSSTYLRGDSSWVSLAASATTDTTNAINISSGTMGTARLGTGTANSSTYLRGDSSWVSLAASATTDTTVATNISSGTLGTARLGSGTANSSTYLRGDQTWISLAASATTDTTVASNISSGTLGTARMGSGTANSTTILRGDNTWGSIVTTLGFTPANIAGDTFSGNVMITSANTTSDLDFFSLKPTGYATNKPGMFFHKDATANVWSIVLYDGTNNNGTLNLKASTVQYNGTAFAASATTDTTNASNISSGTLSTARLGSGTANSTTILRGDNTWASVATTLGFTPAERGAILASSSQGGTFTTDVVLPSAAGASQYSAGWRGIVQNIQNGNYTLVVADVGKYVIKTDANAYTYTVANSTNSSWNSNSGIITIVNDGSAANNITIAGQTGVTLVWAGTSGGTTGSRTLARYGTATLVQIDANRWYVTGSVL